jgi:hypothetical protein
LPLRKHFRDILLTVEFPEPELLKSAAFAEILPQPAELARDVHVLLRSEAGGSAIMPGAGSFRGLRSRVTCNL